MPAADALHAATIVLDDLEHSSLMRAQFESLARPSDVADPQFPEGGEEAIALTATGLRLAEMFYVSADMMQVAEVAALDLSPDLTIEKHMPPNPVGWMLFGAPIDVVDSRALPVKVHAVSWQPLRDSAGKAGARVIWWVRKGDLGDAQNYRVSRSDPALYRALPSWQPLHANNVAWGDMIGLSLAFDKVLPIGADVEVRRSDDDDGIGLSYRWPEGVTPEEMNPHVEPARDFRRLLAIWLLMRQEIAVREPADRPPRSLRRDAERLRMTGTLSVIRLRHAATAHGHGSTEFTHRFLRRGHWRHQWFGSHARGDRRQEWIWIHPTTVGDPDLPLLIREHVTALVR